MFKKRFLAICFVWLGCVLFSVKFLYHPSAHARAAYQRLLELSDLAKVSKTAPDTSVTQQTRVHVTKQLLFNQNNQRLQWRLKSDQSELNFVQQANTIELVEYFKDMTFTIQEKKTGSSTPEATESPQQVVRYLQAQEAVYFYKTGELEATEVKWAHYLLPTHQWMANFEEYKPVFTGIAKKVQLSFNKEPTFKAQDLQATFQEWGSGW